MIVMIVIGAFCIFTNAYFCAWQTYIMIIDVVLHLLAVAFTITEMILSAILLLIFKNLDSAALRA